MILERSVQSITSEEIIEEVARVVAYPKLRFSQELQLRIPQLLRRVSRVVVPVPLFVCFDPSDDKFLACAIAGRADVIVSGDAHLLNLDGWRGIRILTPALSLDALRHG